MRKFSILCAAALQRRCPSLPKHQREAVIMAVATMAGIMAAITAAGTADIMAAGTGRLAWGRVAWRRLPARLG
jgi:hypothetical protein